MGIKVDRWLATTRLLALPGGCSCITICDMIYQMDHGADVVTSNEI